MSKRALVDAGDRQHVVQPVTTAGEVRLEYSQQPHGHARTEPIAGIDSGAAAERDLAALIGRDERAREPLYGRCAAGGLRDEHRAVGGLDMHSLVRAERATRQFREVEPERRLC